MTEIEEKAYLQGRKSLAREFLGYAIQEVDGDVKTRSELIKERAGAIAKLREICAAYGDNDWDDNLHLVDILDKHLLNHLES